MGRAEPVDGTRVDRPVVAAERKEADMSLLQDGVKPESDSETCDYSRATWSTFYLTPGNLSVASLNHVKSITFNIT